VWLDEGGTEAGREAQIDGGTLVKDLREQVLYLRSILSEEREARRRADTIIAQLTQANAALAQGVPELEVPQSKTRRSQIGQSPGRLREALRRSQRSPSGGRGGGSSSGSSG
jgi:hypothetical protein